MRSSSEVEAMPRRCTKPLSAPESLPIGVRAPPTMTEPGMTRPAGVRENGESGGFDFDSWVVGPPHRFVDLLDRVVDGHLCESFLDDGDGDGNGNGGRDGPEVVHRW